MGASGVWQSKRQAKGQEDRVRRELAAEVTDWQQAIRAQALLERQILVRERCLEIWESQADPAVRRMELAALWLNTTESPEGAAVRGVVLEHG